MDKEILDLLHRSFDETLSGDEKHRLQQALAASSEIRKEQQRLRLMRQKIRQSAATTFGEGFTKKVMDALQNEEDLFFHMFLRFVRPTAIAAAILLTGIIAFNLSRADYISWENALGISQTSIEELFDPAQYLALETEQ